MAKLHFLGCILACLILLASLNAVAAAEPYYYVNQYRLGILPTLIANNGPNPNCDGLMGDATGDGYFNEADLNMIKEIIVSSGPNAWTPAEYGCADVDYFRECGSPENNNCAGQGIVSPGDVALIKIFMNYPPDNDNDGYIDYRYNSPGYAAFLPFLTYVGVGDCDDASASVNPGAEEILGNSVDEDCDGVDQVVSGYVDDGLNLVYNAFISIVCRVLDLNVTMASTYTGESCGVGDPTGMGCGYYALNVTSQGSQCSVDAGKDGYYAYSSYPTFPFFNIGVGSRTQNVTLQQAPEVAGEFTGMVIDDSTFLGISGAYVRLKRSDTGAVVQVVKTDSSGNFRIRGVPGGFGYDLVAEASGYAFTYGPTGLSVNPGSAEDVGLILMSPVG